MFRMSFKYYSRKRCAKALKHLCIKYIICNNKLKYVFSYEARSNMSLVLDTYVNCVIYLMAPSAVMYNLKYC
uniref:Uncharacterized protein n=1 Tax=Pararge aegeria TaxID=116150 RepID=S4PUW7_9NEOP